MKILKELRTAAKFDTLITATFGIDLPWFEALILRQLRRRGVRRVMVFADRQEVAGALEENLQRLSGVGRRYILHTLPTRMRFHSKFYFLSGVDRARLYVGSGNLTRGGLDRNLEVFERWDANPGEPVPEIFEQFCDYLGRLVGSVEHGVGLEQDLLDHAVRFLGGTAGRAANPGVRLLSSPGALLDALPEPPRPADELVLSAPFFDAEGAMAVELGRRFKAATLDVITDMRMTNLTPEAVAAIEAAGGRVLKLDQEEEDRASHAKLLFASGEGWALGLTGSANISNAAWRGLNQELVILRTGEAAGQVEALLENLYREDLTDKDRQELVEMAARAREKAEREKEQEAPGGLGVTHAQWADVALTRIQFYMDKPAGEQTKLELRGQRGSVLLELPEPSGGGYRINAPRAIKRGEPASIRRVEPDAVGPCCLVHDPMEIRLTAERSSPEREELEQLLGSDHFDAEAARSLVVLFAKILRGRLERRRAAAAQGSGGAGARDGGDDQQPRQVGLDDFTRAPDTREKRSWASSGALSVQLMNRLLFGDEEHQPINADDGESENDDGEDQDGVTAQQGGSSGSGGGGPGKSSESPSKAQRKAFIEAAGEARELYVAQLRQAGDRSPYRLLDDLQILAAPLHYMVQGGGMPHFSFCSEMATILAAFLGGPRTPFIRSLRQLQGEEKEDFWLQTPTMLLLLQLVYNVCQANFNAKVLDRAPRVSFPDVHPVLWLRHLLREAPAGIRAALAENTAHALPALRVGALWISDLWPHLERAIGFPTFVCRMVRDAAAIDAVEELVRTRGLRPGVGRQEDGEPVLCLRGQGVMAVGWLERPTAQLYDTAFQSAGEQQHLAPMLCVAEQVVIPLEKIVSLVADGPLEVRHGLEVLEEIANS